MLTPALRAAPRGYRGKTPGPPPFTDVLFDGGVSEWKVVRRRNSAFSEREREETVVPVGMTASV